jgi:putative hydrolase of the HAD superfamily
MTIKHISFDFYNTFATPNPTFAKERNDLLANLFGLTDDEIKKIYKTLKDFYDSCAAQDGVAGTPILAWSSFLDVLNENFDSMDAWQITSPVAIYNDVAELFVQYPPSLAPNIETLLDRLSQDNITFSITSNTNFVGGYVLDQVIYDMLINVSPDQWFTLYSDDVGVSKPHRIIFETMFSTLNLARRDVQKSEVLHVGDMQETDIVGAEQFGINALLISNPDELVEKVGAYLNDA